MYFVDLVHGACTRVCTQEYCIESSSGADFQCDFGFFAAQFTHVILGHCSSSVTTQLEREAPQEANSFYSESGV